MKKKIIFDINISQADFITRVKDLAKHVLYHLNSVHSIRTGYCKYILHFTSTIYLSKLLKEEYN